MNTMSFWRFVWGYFFPRRSFDLTGDGASKVYAAMAMAQGRKGE